MHELSGFARPSCDRSSDISIVLEKPKRDMQQAMPGRTERLYAALMIGSTGENGRAASQIHCFGALGRPLIVPLARSKPRYTAVTLPLAMSYTAPTTFTFPAATRSERSGFAVARYLTLSRTFSAVASARRSAGDFACAATTAGRIALIRLGR